jgi:broad specificity phosphatase PhoE
MKQLTFVRHGETGSNAARVFNFKTEPLNETGKKQALRLAQKLSVESFDLILCSPLARTRSTLEPILEWSQVPVEYWNELVEFNFGNLEGEAYLEVENLFSGLARNLYRENTQDLKLRAEAFWNLISDRHEQNILIVSHGAIMCLLFAVYYKVAPENYENFRINDWEFMDNCDVKKLIIE